MMQIITADAGSVFRRIHDGFVMSETIYLGIDYSTGTPREDRAEYYEQVPAPAMDEPVAEAPGGET